MSTLKDRVLKALQGDNSIVVSRDKLHEHKGFTQPYMESLGLSKVDLKKLERHGLAARGYTKNTYTEGDKLPNGNEVKPNERFNGRGHHPVWVLVGNDQQTVDKDQKVVNSNGE